MTATPPDARDAIVLGMDGVPWPLVDRWIDAGHLEHFARLRSAGASAPLESTTPPTTSLAWPSIATGVRPDKHGIYWFQSLGADHTHTTHTSADVEQPPIWDIASPSVVGNVPMTYPATEFDGGSTERSESDGALVSGMMAPGVDADGFTHPPSLADHIQEQIPSYRVGLNWSKYQDDPDALVDEVDALVDARAELARTLLARDWRLFFFVFTAPDRLQHLVWDEDILLEHYERLDAALGEMMDAAEERDANLFVVSDHGFGPVSGAVSGNAVLEQAGHLVRKADDGSTRTLLDRLGVTKDTVSSLLARAGMDENDLVGRLPKPLVDAVASTIPGEHAIYDVDYSETAAFFHGAGNLYVNDTERFDPGVVDPDDVDDFKRELVELFATLTDPETGEPVLRVDDGDELFPTDPDSPDLVVTGIGEHVINTGLTDDVFLRETSKVADHRPEGVFFAWGPDVEAGAAPEDASVFDVTPTVLHALGDAVPENADGRVLAEIFDPMSAAAGRSVETREYRQDDDPVAVDEDAADYEDGDAERDGDDGTDGDETDENMDDVEDRLRGLGYID
ncbi:alkaline phosphatase family protein [Halobacterium zhouii]|uniref:alkaline phosphatase family protein n=1 Tax=Halobacterium zhouii TaxID=2902624 RepID=UPI001E569C4F|nr:alkaline phosphatase family protein [Halobacterium zhouii]